MNHNTVIRLLQRFEMARQAAPLSCTDCSLEITKETCTLCASCHAPMCVSCALDGAIVDVEGDLVSRCFGCENEEEDSDDT